MVRKKGLGKGLDALLSSQRENSAPREASIEPNFDAKDGSLRYLPVEIIQRGKYQPRRDMQPEALEELADSIKSQGVMQPIVVRAISADRYEIIAGERRWRASQLAGLDKIPAVIREVPDEAAIAMALIENIQRENLNPIEEAMALQRLKDEFELTQQDVANAVGKSRTTVTNLLRLMTLNEDVRRMLEYGDLEMGHARALLGLQGSDQSKAAEEVVAGALSVRQTESLVRDWHHQPTKTAKPQKTLDPNISRLQDDLSEKLGVPVTVKHGANGKGSLVLKYSSLDELDGILAHLV
jgi:ParB family transcriptional regulator, chromosome partitioning protein